MDPSSRLATHPQPQPAPPPQPQQPLQQPQQPLQHSGSPPGGNAINLWSPVSGTAPTPEKWTADFASTRWLDLLANDAAQADVSFSLAPTPEPEDKRPSWQVAHPEHVSPAILSGEAQLPENLDPEDERKYWQSEGGVLLNDHEAVLFRHFADSCAKWLDVLDQNRLFSTYAIRLSLKNVGLMKAILALSAKHRTKCLGIQPQQRTASVDQGMMEDGGKDDEWIGYYYETLHYIRKALAYSSYTHSEELLATAIVISTYEMLDESDGSGNWQRHLKGVFWIQRSQDSDGGCGGLRQAVWWAWLKQDIWAAFRERRPCLSFWAPKKDLADMNQHELGRRAIYLLSQAVNYSAEARKAEAMGVMPEQLFAVSLQQRREGLLAHMERWKSFLKDEYNFLPTPQQNPDDVFTPLWVHPPDSGVALQAYSFASILITLHTPNGSGLSAFLRIQKQLSAAVNIICGIAMATKDEGCQMLSAQCLFGAGLCVQDHTKREKIISLIRDCEARVGWAPINTWIADLRAEWAKVDGDIQAGLS